MNKELRRVSIVVLIMFLALFGSSTVIQVFQQDNLKADSRNVRTLYASFSAERGPILVAGQPIAQSVPSTDEYKYQRQYSNGPLYSAVTGYFTLNQGNTGVEGSLNDYLSGTANQQFLDQLNAIITGQNPKGAAVELTIDPKVQQAAWDALGDYQGAVVALNPKTGAILAMVSKPTFDPNTLAVHDSKQVIATYKQLLGDSGQPLINRAIAGSLNPPGSTFKLVVTATALESGKYTPDSEFPNPGALQLPQSSTVITNAEGGSCGGGATASIATALRLSCNIPFAQLGLALGNSAISAEAKKFGFGDSGIRIPMKVTPSVYPSTDSDAQQMISSFGQGNDRVTPLQMAMVSATVANGGQLMSPTLIDSITAPDLSVLQKLQPTVYNTPISSATATTMTQLMINNVANGAASNARISGVDVAGKTGTAQNGQGAPYTLWFTGFAPANDPQVAVAVVVENGGGRGQSAFGNLLAAPIAKKVIEAVLNR
ncbi:peptidoglycan D,D-transpeptidase FtsI family protein [Lysinimonas soli]|uniref:Peptidoglycan D,D-transpeptidase FtsI family protein n=1 Tax=Lysinimonas soli TaxID=1074233 RepID=A0ABW0NSR0_9MICO